MLIPLRSLSRVSSTDITNYTVDAHSLKIHHAFYTRKKKIHNTHTGNLYATASRFKAKMSIHYYLRELHALIRGNAQNNKPVIRAR